MMGIRHLQPHPSLRDLIGKMWIFQSNGRVPDEDMKLIVPNGMAKLVIPFRNGVVSKTRNWHNCSREATITLIGCADSPSVVDMEEDKPSGTIGFEFTPKGTYRFFATRHREIANRVLPLTDVLGSESKMLQKKVSDTRNVYRLIDFVQAFLMRRLRLCKDDFILDHCLDRIYDAGGVVTVRQLEKETGYSSRWLFEKFIEKVGVGPKTFSSIVRFGRFYRLWARNGMNMFRGNIYDYFYDQSHFIKEFKRFTGLAPTKFLSSRNEFGRLFYKG